MTGASGRWPLPLLLLLCLPVNGESPGSSGPHPRHLAPQATGSAQAPDRMADKSLLPALEASLLGVFGLPRRPRPSGSAQIPSFMNELYQNQVQSRTQSQRQGHLRAHGRGPVQANTVRSFYHTDLQSSPDCPEQTCQRLWFNVSTLPPAETLTYAELRVFLDQPALRHAANGGKDAMRGPRVEVHEIMQPAGQDSDPIVRLLDTRKLVLSGEAWESFDVHPAVLKWQKTPHLNHGLEVRVVSDSPAVSTDAHVRLRRSAGDAQARWQSERPLLVTYTDDGKGANSRVKRSSEDGANGSKHGDTKGRRKRENAKRERRRRRGRNRKRKNRKKGERRRRKHKNQCRRHALYVDFSDVGWNDWIVAPTGYNAYYCSGECDFPLADHLNSTNHAIVQTLVNSVNPSAVPKACCVPTELSAISMLYLDEYDMVVLKNYQDMVVESCGCR